MAKTPDRRSGKGVFGPGWHQWHRALLKVEPEDGPEFVGRLTDVKVGTAVINEVDRASLALDRVVEVHRLPWPPPGVRVTILRT